MRRFLGTALPAAAALLFACATSHVEDSWTDPDVVGGRLGLRKVAAIAMFDEGAMRRVAEDGLARAIDEGGEETGSGVDAVPSYTLLDAEVLRDPDRVRSELASAGFDGAVVVKVVDARERISTTPSVRTGWGYYGRGWGVLYDTGSVRSDTVVRVQTNIYSVAGRGKLLWSGTTKTYNPRDVSDLIGDVTRDVGRELRKQGLIGPT